MKSLKLLLVLILIAIFSTQNCFATEATKYDDINFPQWTIDLRRTEIITFGSLPFVTLWTSVGYGLATQGRFHNPLDKSAASWDENEQKQIIAIAACTSLGLGLTDLAINLITRKYRKHKQSKIEKTIIVIPLSQQMKELPPPDEIEREQVNDQEVLPVDEAENEAGKEYMMKGLENAVF